MKRNIILTVKHDGGRVMVRDFRDCFGASEPESLNVLILLQAWDCDTQVYLGYTLRQWPEAHQQLDKK